VIPREVLRQVKRLEISTRHLVNDVFSGQYHSVFKGRGMEFDEVREYQPGDDFRTIDWNVTARSGHPFVKRYVEERELTVMLLVDLSRSGEFGSEGRTKNAVAAELSALLAFSATKNKDKVGLLAFTDRVERFIPPKKSRSHVLRLVRDILALKPSGRRTDLGLALQQVGRLVKRRAVVFLISDFIARGYEPVFRVTARRHDLIGVRLRDRRESELPAIGLVEMEDLERGVRVLVDTSAPAAREAHALAARRRDGELRELFLSTGTDLVDIPPDGNYVVPLIRFFRTRARRARSGR
jgi:uncharacterized protein (DUF58 family)